MGVPGPRRAARDIRLRVPGRQPAHRSHQRARDVCRTLPRPLGIGPRAGRARAGGVDRLLELLADGRLHRRRAHQQDGRRGGVDPGDVRGARAGTDTTVAFRPVRRRIPRQDNRRNQGRGAKGNSSPLRDIRLAERRALRVRHIERQGSEYGKEVLCGNRQSTLPAFSS